MSFHTLPERLLEAIHDRLSASAELMGLLGNPLRIYDHAPEDPVFPYLTFGPLRSTDISGDDTPLMSHVLSVHIWSRYSGRKEVMQAISLVSDALSEQEITLDGMKTISITTVYRDIFNDSDGRTRHGVLRLSITTSPQN